MNRREIAPNREWRRSGKPVKAYQITGYESPQRRRYLRELAEQETSQSV
ncbi:hypothetical protein SynBIOSU31_00795 [Synechococcus sp. BIOS-U3-1]|nr:hypothetical protein SynBIOSU31_00795 [Synechococcus sp. BIOS-U3-1]